MSEKNDSKAFDPFDAWRDMRDASMDAWAKAMVQTVNTEGYAQASGTMLDAYLTASIPFRQMLEKAMAQALQQVNMPSREDLISLATRLTQIETAMDDLDTKLDLALQARPAEAASPKATKKEAK